ncbi:hypothetical protein INT43_004663 [Umbelopsis isabellina]|uniref:Uncharacterized protein n=1 Tax=Mortierella isabellina TaxID=91625 RepID=A0A8H7UB89_MORIS|nr:hypothetical protein INT43_004663 [Umbelopsis isabellina]
MESIPASSNAIVRWFKLDQFEPERAVTSHWVSSKTFLLIRTLPTLYAIIIMFADIGTTAQSGTFNFFFAYFTNLTYIGLFSYLVCVYTHHVRYLLTPKPHTPNSFFQQWPILNYLFVILYHTVVCYNVITPVIFWSLLSGSLIKNGATPEAWWMACSVHAASFFQMMIDVIFNRMIMVPRMVIFELMGMILYMCLAFVIYGVDHVWTYAFLDWSQGGKAAIWYVVVAAVAVIVFFLMYGVHRLRDFIASRAGRNNQHEQFDLEKTDYEHGAETAPYQA